MQCVTKNFFFYCAICIDCITGLVILFPDPKKYLLLTDFQPTLKKEGVLNSDVSVFFCSLKSVENPTRYPNNRFVPKSCKPNLIIYKVNTRNSFPASASLETSLSTYLSAVTSS